MLKKFKTVKDFNDEYEHSQEYKTTSDYILYSLDSTK
jgi:hypothetical protein